MQYLVFTFEIESPFSEVLQFELGQIGFDVFLETDKGFETSILETDFHDHDFQEIIEKYQADSAFRYQWRSEAKQNWNELWEKFYDPIIIADKCLIRADFHQLDKTYPYELVITPKMSFGTGHHATTALMVEHLLEMTLTDNKVVDCGCGTGILGLMALKLGAKQAEGCDIEEWAVENTLENAERNNLTMKVLQGTAQDITGQFEIVLANITLNVLLEEMPIYDRLLATGGEVLFSGFYEDNILTLQQRAEQFGFQLISSKTKDRWAAVRFQKQASFFLPL